MIISRTKFVENLYIARENDVKKDNFIKYFIK